MDWVASHVSERWSNPAQHNTTHFQSTTPVVLPVSQSFNYTGCAEIALFTNWRLVATLRQASLSAPFFQQHVLTLYLSSTFWQFSQYFRLFLFYYIRYGDLWSVMFDVTTVIVLGRQEPRPHKTANLIDKCCVCFYCPTYRPFPRLTSSRWASLFPETKQYWNWAT
jgi:hypothetical protein